MNNTLRQKLREIILNHGPEVSRDPKRCKALLLDYGGQSQGEIFALVAAVEERIPEYLLNARESELVPGLTTRLAHRVAEPRSMELETAQWAVESWAFALDIAALAISADPQPPAIPSPFEPDTPQKTTDASRDVLAPGIPGKTHTPPLPATSPAIDAPVAKIASTKPSSVAQQLATSGIIVGPLLIFGFCILIGIAMIITPFFQRNLPVVTTTVPAGNDAVISLENASLVKELESWGKGNVWEIAYSADGRLLAVATTVGIYLYDAQTLVETRHIGSEFMTTIAFSPDGTKLAAGNDDGVVTIWRASDGASFDDGVQVPREDNDSVYSLAFSPDSTTLAIGAFSGAVDLWRVNDDATFSRSMQLHTQEEDGPDNLVFSPDGTILAAGTYDSVVYLWQVSDGALLRTLEGHDWYISGVAFSPDGTTLASGSGDSTIKIWQVNDGTLLRTIREEAGYISNVVFSPDGAMLAAGSTSGSVKLWQASDGALLRTLRGHASAVQDVIFSPDGKTLISWSLDSIIELWQLDNDTRLVTLETHNNYIPDVVFATDGSVLAPKFLKDSLELWQVSGRASFLTSARLYAIKENSPVRRVVFSPDKTMLAWTSEDNDVRLWRGDDVDGAAPHVLKGHSDVVNAIAFSPDGAVLASASDDQTIKLWQVSDGALLRTVRVHDGAVDSVAFSPDGITLASAGFIDHSMKLLHVSTGGVLSEWEDSDMCSVMAFPSDGDLLVTACWGGDIKLWGINGTLLYTLRGHTREVLDVAFSPDRKIMASASGDGAIKLWKAFDDTLLCTLEGHVQDVQSVAFSPDGTTLISQSKDGTVRLWEVPELP